MCEKCAAPPPHLVALYDQSFAAHSRVLNEGRRWAAERLLAGEDPISIWRGLAHTLEHYTDPVCRRRDFATLLAAAYVMEAQKAMPA